jgi:hypothetical protein
VAALAAEVEEETAGDPMSEKKWVRRSLRKLSQALQDNGFLASSMTVRRLLREDDYSLKANRKENTASHPERDQQFRYIRRVKRLFLEAGHPVISVDMKKKELIGEFKNSGRAWCQEAERVNVHDCRGDAIGLAAPYGIYDLLHNLGYVYVGTSADTAELAVDAIVWWWHNEDRPHFLNEGKLLILCDAGGSNGYRLRLWKKQIQEQLADRLGIEIMICHYPTGASKWNPIEHRLFSYISMNWAGIPLRTFEALLGYIRDTTTEMGLRVQATLSQKVYQKAIKVSDKEMATLNLTRRKVCPQWNYIIKPCTASP